MNYLDLFSGIGGFAYGAYMAGFKAENHFYSEIDKYCIELYKKRFPDSIYLGDIKKIDCEKLKKEYPGDWVITGGFPCQDISIAGKGVGLNGKRSGLWFEMFRIIRELRPKFVIAENVSAITFRGLDRVLSCLAEIGYDAEWQDIRASDMGAPHRRERIWIVAYADTCSKPRFTESKQQYARTKEFNGSCDNGMEAGHELANAKSTKCEQPRNTRTGGHGLTNGSKILNTNGIDDKSINKVQKGKASLSYRSGGSDWWSVEPAVGRAFDGIPMWMDRHIEKGVSLEEKERAIKLLPELWGNIDTETVQRTIRGFDRFQKAEVLFSLLREYEENPDQTRILTQSEKAFEEFVRGVWIRKELNGASYRSGHNKQQTGKHSDAMQTLPQFLAHDGKENWEISSWEDGIPRVKTGLRDLVNRLKCLGNSIVPQIAKILFQLCKENL